MSLADFSQLATNVFTAKSVDDKREACYVMITEMRSKEAKKAVFREQVSRMNANRLDKFAADCFLVDTDKVIK